MAKGPEQIRLEERLQTNIPGWTLRPRHDFYETNEEYCRRVNYHLDGYDELVVKLKEMNGSPQE